MTEAELNVATASLDADGSGDISFSEFYGWLTDVGDAGTEYSISNTGGDGSRAATGDGVPVSGESDGSAANGRMGSKMTVHSGFVKVESIPSHVEYDRSGISQGGTHSRFLGKLQIRTYLHVYNL